MIIPLIIKTFEKKHSVEYKSNKYTIKENYNKEGSNHYYEFKINNNKETYSYILNENVNKRKKIIKEIKEYKKDNIKCIIPIYVKEIDYNIYCLEDNKQV